MKKKSKTEVSTFSHFISEPPVSVALVAFAMIALVLALIEFAQNI